MARPAGKPIDPSMIARVVAGVRYAVTGKAPDWFGPQEPPAPAAPAETAGRQFDYRPGYNLSNQPRAEEPISFRQLRALADNYDLMRLVIETRKDQLVKCKWAIQPKDTSKKAGEDGRVKEVTDFLADPDKEHDWDTWLRMLIEDQLVIDAACLYPRKTRGGALYALEPVDGATIKRVIDGHGRTPLPPSPAYQQVLKGIPAVDYTRDQLLYLPRNMRTNRIYGMSPVEQVVMTVNIALRRQKHQLEYYTEGTVPDALAGVPDGWTPEQIAQYQEYWDAMLAEETSNRRKVRWVPGSIAKSFVQTKEAALKDEYDEWLARIMCYCFAVSNQPFIKQQSRAESETSAQAAMKEGLAPLMKWVKSVIDRVLRQCWGYTDLEFVWQEEEDTDSLKQAQVNDIKVRAGAKTINEWRAEDGEEAIPGGDVPLIYTASGAVRLEDTVKPPEPVPSPLLGHNGGPPIDGEAADPADAAAGAAEKLAKAAGSERDRPFVAGRQRKLNRLWRRFLKAEGKRCAAAVAELWRPMDKAAGDNVEDGGDAKAANEAGTTEDAATARATRIAASAIESAGWEKAVSDTVEILADVARDGVAQAAKTLDLASITDLTSVANPRAVEWAEARGAKLVGDLTETTRAALRATIVKAEKEGWSVDQLKRAIMDNHAFSASRAATIAQHELLKADNQGNLIGWRKARDLYGLKLGKKWIVSTLEGHCPACEWNAEEGPIDLDEVFLSGHDCAPAHPHCTCDTVAVVGHDPKAEKWEGPRADGPFDRPVVSPQRLAKYNPYRDQFGRFARGPESGSGSGGITHSAFVAGLAPVALIKSVLGQEHAPGKVRISAVIHTKMATKHRRDYPVCQAHLSQCLKSPDYMGIHPDHPGKIMLVKRVSGLPDGKVAMLFPVGMTRDRRGDYGGASAYGISEKKIGEWTASGNLRAVAK